MIIFDWLIMAKRCHIILLFCLVASFVANAQEARKHSLSADVAAQGVMGYNLTYQWYGGADLKGVFHYDNTDFTLNFEALTAKTFSLGLTVGQSFNVCRNGFVFLEGTLHSRIFAKYKAYEFVYAASAGFKMLHFSAQIGLFSRTIDALGRDWHSLDNYVTEPFNLLYKVKISVMGFNNPWDVYAVFANYTDYEYERMWEPIFSVGGRWDFKERWSAMAEGTFEAAGIFHGTVKFYEATFRAGVSFRLERSALEKSPTK